MNGSDRSVPAVIDKPRNSRSAIWFIAGCLAPAVLLVLVFTYYPMLRGVTMAFQNYTLFDLSDARFVGFGNFKEILDNPQFITALKNSVYWVFFSLICQFVLGFGIALLLKNRFFGRGFYQGMIFFPWAMSGFLIGLIWRWLYNGQIGVINNLLIKIGLIDTPIPFLSSPKWGMFAVITANVWYGIAFFAIMLLAALQSVPEEISEAAEVDGANRLQRLFRITIPYIMPTILTTVILRIIWIMNFPDLIYAMTNGGPAGSTHILATYMMDKIIFGGDYGKASAVGVVMMVVLVLFMVFYFAAARREKAGDF
ncbi:carbohydrate ABC transporter permease [Cohnella thermotolerans]|uniref:carbohydrate ABC transporter permease n=1 Tax=Cohnella thermotolerans TaxID=329858 RepID=UPI000421C692|nr:sugar ABC transporter permease [Cohnella thermotolerans]